MEANETTGSLKEIRKSDPLEIGSRIISGIFTPFMVPFLAFFLLFFFTYLRIMPLQYKLVVLGIVYCFTILMPMLAIYLFQKIAFVPNRNISIFVEINLIIIISYGN